ncbi:hypothetical protein M0804_007742 [Polistes exclamans]|nr:hypothetical protein M0804_007742 [Polistes exclamans]
MQIEKYRLFSKTTELWAIAIHEISDIKKKRKKEEKEEKFKTKILVVLTCYCPFLITSPPSFFTLTTPYIRGGQLHQKYI